MPTPFVPYRLIERRRYRRFSVTDSSFFLTKGSTKEPVGQLVDISTCGLSFIYAVNGEKDVIDDETITIVRSTLEVCIEGLFYRNVNDFDVTESYPSFKVEKRRRGLELIKLSQKQIRDVAALIESECGR